MTSSTIRLAALLSSSLASPLLVAVPATAQTLPVDVPATPQAQPQEQAVRPVDEAGTEDRLIALGGQSGVIRPFAGGILPYAGTIRTFAGPVSGTAGTIRSFQGDSIASAGTIRSFAGTIRSFAGTIRSFQTASFATTGPDRQFWGSAYPASGSLTASAGTIRSFAGEFEGMAGTIRSFAGTIRSFDGSLLTWSDGAPQYTQLNGQIAAMVAGSKATWGSAVAAQTGRSFEAGFSDRMLAKYGINLSDPQSLVGMDELGLEMFMLDWYDNLQLYSGADQIDHWMSAINWTPRITQDLGSGRDSKIGLLDFTVTGEGVSNIVKASGVSTVGGLHGSAVLSLMTAAHDGRGVMGIAPGASVVTFNPFDGTYTAGWSDITAGVANLVKNGATIVNMSLGVPGWTLNPGWNSVFASGIGPDAKKRVFVLAAGNDGITQTQNIQWNWKENPAIIVVGSVDPSGTISDFSNRPGTVCLSSDGKTGANGDCKVSPDRAQLMTRFIVAPGEFILVSDGQGGVTRMSGTSFAAPLVSGTVALIHDRWPWLRDKPADTAELVLSSARDVGAPGIDPVYGRGMLDVAAALSPASLAALKYKVSINGSGLQDVKVATLTPAQRTAMVSTWEATSAYVVAFDDTLTSYRDFAIPLSTKLAGQTYGSNREQFASYLTSRFTDWFVAGGTTGPLPGPAPKPFGAARHLAPMMVTDTFALTMSAAQKAYRPGFRQDGVPFETGVSLTDAAGRFAVRFGTGRGGSALGQQAFAMQSDYDLATGGANPFLGLASGAGYAVVDLRLATNVTVSTGLARQDAQHDLRWTGQAERAGLGGLQPYQATASTMSVSYRPAGWLTATVGYTGLAEGSALLGMQSLDRNDFGHGSRSDAATAGLDLALPAGFSVAGTATVGRTLATRGDRQAIGVAPGGITSSAFQAEVIKTGLVGSDRLRVTLAQPLHVEGGEIEVSNVQVVDRQTGALGTVVQTFDIQGRQRRLVGEVLYGREVMGGRAQLNLFGRAGLAGGRPSSEAAVMAGSSFRLTL